MGTSRNDASPSNPPWRMATSLLGRPDIDVVRQLNQIWRAAEADLGPDLEGGFYYSALQEGFRIASAGMAPQDALEVFDTYLNETREASLNIDIARRALVRTCASEGGGGDYMAELFSDATAYYAARDLPGFVGAEGRVRNVSQALSIKRSLQREAVEVVKKALSNTEIRDNWHASTSEILRLLKA